MLFSTTYVCYKLRDKTVFVRIVSQYGITYNISLNYEDIISVSIELFNQSAYETQVLKDFQIGKLILSLFPILIKTEIDSDSLSCIKWHANMQSLSL